MEALEQQLAMNRQSWAALQQHGVDETTELQLEFFYYAPGQENATRLAGLLRNETNYDIDVQPPSEDSDKWGVIGRTQPTTLTLAILDEWVEWMVLAGAQHGCEFDGWGAEVP